MSINLVFKGMDVSAAMLDSFSKEFRNMVGITPASKVNGVIEATNDPKNKFSIGVNITGDGKNIFAKESGNDAYHIMKQASKTVEKIILKDKNKTLKH